MSARLASPYPTTSDTALLSALFEGMAEPMLLCDAGLRVLAANRAAVELLKFPAGSSIYRSAQEVLPPHSSLTEGNRARTPGRVEWCSGRLRVSGVALNGIHGRAEGWALTLEPLGPREEPPEFIGNAPVTQELLEFVTRIARSRATSILLLGESGTGKELIARRLHALSPRSAAAFVPINCAALPENLLESELFGYEKGAFTGANLPKAGLLEIADGGTVFLDEIGELPVPLQAKLLRVLEERTFRRIGGVRTISPDLRIVGATNANLAEAIEDRRFRIDLYYRLNGVQIQLPALRERLEDIGMLAMHFLEYFSRVHRKHIRGIHPTAHRMLNLYQWPGNVRELRNVMERAVLVESDSLLTPASIVLPKPPQKPWHDPAAIESPPPAAPFCLRSGERELIVAALTESNGNQSRAAAMLGIGRFSLRYKMKKLGML